MKAVWHIITIVALANLIAIGGFVWWLHFSGRLDMGRVEAVRTMLSETLAEQQARESAEAAQTQTQAEQAAEIERMSGPPVTASEVLSLRIETSEEDLQRISRLRREVRDLSETLASERRKLDAERAKFEEQKAEFALMRQRLEEIEGDEQFIKSLGVLESLKAAEAKQTLMEIIETDREQAVSYLDAMQDRPRTKIFNEMVTDGQADLAAELLEEIRVRGLETVGP